MSTGIFLSYKGLGTNILHLPYCHEIAKKYGPVEIITLSDNFKDVVEGDPLIKKVICLSKYYKKITYFRGGCSQTKIRKQRNSSKYY